MYSCAHSFFYSINVYGAQPTHVRHDCMRERAMNKSDEVPNATLLHNKTRLKNCSDGNAVEVIKVERAHSGAGEVDRVEELYGIIKEGLPDKMRKEWGVQSGRGEGGRRAFQAQIEEIQVPWRSAGHIQTTARRLVAGAYRKWWNPCRNHGQSITKCYLFNHLKIILNHALLSIPQFWLIFSPPLTSLVANFSSMHFPVWILALCY